MYHQKLKILSSHPVRRPNVCHSAKFRADRSDRRGDIADFFIFEDGGHLTSCICSVRVWTTNTKGIFLVFATVENLVVVYAMISITMQVLIICA